METSVQSLPAAQLHKLSKELMGSVREDPSNNSYFFTMMVHEGGDLFEACAQALTRVMGQEIHYCTARWELPMQFKNEGQWPTYTASIMSFDGHAINEKMCLPIEQWVKMEFAKRAKRISKDLLPQVRETLHYDPMPHEPSWDEFLVKPAQELMCRWQHRQLSQRTEHAKTRARPKRI